MTRTIDSIEQELTYLAASFPEGIESATPTRLKDVYIPDTDGVHPQLRLRQKGDKYEITKKVPLKEGDASAHTELTIPLKEDEFLALEKSSSKIVEKDRYVIDIDGHPAEIDVFVGDLDGLVLIDFEFNDEAAKNNFTPPSVCLVDVTQEKFIAGGLLAGKSYSDIQADLDEYNYSALSK